jgi:hypothetical protein
MFILIPNPTASINQAKIQDNFLQPRCLPENSKRSV